MSNMIIVFLQESNFQKEGEQESLYPWSGLKGNGRQRVEGSRERHGDRLTSARHVT